MAAKLHRTFPSREHFAETFVRRLSDRGIEFRLAGEVSPPTGTVLDLDLRLEDGSPLIVGTGEVTSGGRNADRFRVRFLELTAATRATLDRLVLLVAANTNETPTRPTMAGVSSGASIRDLVEGVYGEKAGSGSIENSAVMVPPDPGQRPARPAAGTAERRTSGRRSIFQRLQVSPAVVIVAIIAGASGAAANAWFQDLAGFVSNLTGDQDEGAVDILPTNITPSDFSGEGAEANGPPVADSTTGGSTEAAGGEGFEARAVPILSGAAGDAGPDALTAEETASAAAPGAHPANRVSLITWDEYPAETVVTFHGNGPFLPDRVLRLRVAGGRPRELIKIRGIDLPFRETLIQTATPELERIRTGFHPQSQVNELHAVLDLTGPDVHLDRVELGANTLELHLRTVTPDAGGAAEAD